MSAAQEEKSSAAPFCLFLFALWIRALPLGRVFDGERTVFAGNDAWYHMHRVRESLEAGGWPAPLSFDPMLNWPHGARPIWTPLFDAIVGAVALPFYALGGMDAAEAAAAWIPPILGSLCVVALYFAARKLTDETTARIAGVVLAVLFAHTWYSQVGFVDHHVAVTLAAAALLLAAVRFAASPDLLGSLIVSVCAALSLLLWPGALIHVVLVELGLALALALSRATTPALSKAYGFRAIGHGFAFFAIAPFCFGQEWPQWSVYSANVLSLFQPLLFSALGVHAALVSLRTRSKSLTSAGPRLANLAGLGLVVLVACLALVPGLREAAAEAWSWFARDEAFQANVAESEPLLVRGGELALDRVALRLSWFFPLLPLMWGAFVWSTWKQPAAAGCGTRGAYVFATWALGIGLAAMAQKRFTHSASLAAALLIAWSLTAVFPALARRTSQRVAGGTLAVLTLLCLAPSLQLHAQTLSASFRGELTTAHHGKRRLHATGDWLRENASDTRHGVLAPWHLGHPLLYVSRLPMVVGNFGDDVGSENFELAQEYFRSTEARGTRLLDRVDARFVVIETLSADDRDRFGPRMMYRRLALPVLRDLGQHRLRYASPSDDRPASAASYRVFERVAGAVVEGQAAPGSLVTAQIRIGRAGAPIGGAIVAGEADASGRYSLRLAQAGLDGVTGAWTISNQDRIASMAIPEAAVVRGASIAGPDFASARE